MQTLMIVIGIHIVVCLIVHFYFSDKNYWYWPFARRQVGSGYFRVSRFLQVGTKQIYTFSIVDCGLDSFWRDQLESLDFKDVVYQVTATNDVICIRYFGPGTEDFTIYYSDISKTLSIFDAKAGFEIRDITVLDLLCKPKLKLYCDVFASVKSDFDGIKMQYMENTRKAVELYDRRHDESSHGPADWRFGPRI